MSRNDHLDSESESGSCQGSAGCVTQSGVQRILFGSGVGLSVETGEFTLKVSNKTFLNFKRKFTFFRFYFLSH